MYDQEQQHLSLVNQFLVDEVTVILRHVEGDEITSGLVCEIEPNNEWAVGETEFYLEDILRAYRSDDGGVIVI